jgi:hypothetical protein
VDGIGIREASRKYGVPGRTISRWVARGLIRVLVAAENRGQATLIYEPDLIAILPQYSGRPGRGHGPKLENLRAAS